MAPLYRYLYKDTYYTKNNHFYICATGLTNVAKVVTKVVIGETAGQGANHCPDCCA